MENEGKGYVADRAVQDEVMGRAGRSHSVRQGATKRARIRRTISLWRRRFEYPKASRADANAQRKTRRGTANCPHKEVRWAQVPHPRYGDRQPYFVDHLVSLAGTEHVCVAGR